MAAKHKFAIAACARWETRYIVEWLTYYRAIGFDHVYLYCNDDEPGAFYERVLPFLQGPAPFVTFYFHAAQGEQTAMYMHFLANHPNEAEWVSFFDIDEFLRLPPGETIGDFIGRFPPEIDSVLFNWVFFGPGEHEEAPVGNVLENFTNRAISVHPLTKQVTRARCLGSIAGWIDGRATPFWHWPTDFVAAPMRVVNVLGEDCTTYAEGFPDRAASWVNEPARRQALLDTAVIHHYALRGRDAYSARAARGLGGNFDGQTVWSDIAEGDGLDAHIAQVSAIRDERLAGFWPALRARAAGHATRAVPISRGKTATASSVHPGHGLTLPPDANRAVNGVIDGTRKFHTAREANPWWQVDLGGLTSIGAIHVYNTSDHTAARCRDISLSVSIDGTSWAELVAKRDGTPVGNLISGPFIWSGPGAAWGRYVRVTLLGEDYLHLDQVEVFDIARP